MWLHDVPVVCIPLEVVIGLAVCACLLFFLVLLLFVVLCRQKETSTGYSHVINDGDENSWQSYRLLGKDDTWDGEDDLWTIPQVPHKLLFGIKQGWNMNCLYLELSLLILQWQIVCQCCYSHRLIFVCFPRSTVLLTIITLNLQEEF